VSPTVEYEVYALKFAEHPYGVRGSYFYGAEPSRFGEVIPLAYYVWLLRSPDQEIVVDLGFTPETAAARDRGYVRSPVDALQELGTDPAAVAQVVLTHLHWDHVGTHEAFPAAQFSVQAAEMSFWNGRYASRPQLRRLVEVEDMESLTRLSLDGRLDFVDGDSELAPGITLHHVGGHSPGMQVVRVHTARGHVVLASDAAHLYENFEQDAPFGIFTDLPGMYRTFDRLHALADAPELVIPGHDPDVLRRFEPVDGHDDLTVRIA
jgi:glyoxylase-like metal-dependent hydrolase (beta-lactamase superfamily II)